MQWDWPPIQTLAANTNTRNMRLQYPPNTNNYKMMSYLSATTILCGMSSAIGTWRVLNEVWFDLPFKPKQENTVKIRKNNLVLLGGSAELQFYVFTSLA